MVIEVVDRINDFMAPAAKWLWLSLVPLLMSLALSADSARGMV